MIGIDNLMIILVIIVFIIVNIALYYEGKDEIRPQDDKRYRRVCDDMFVTCSIQNKPIRVQKCRWVKNDPNIIFLKNE